MSKCGLFLQKPWMNSAGALGFAPEVRQPVPWSELGAFVTAPVSWRARLPAAEPALVEFPGGFLLHSGLPNPGLPAVLKQYAHIWARSTLPVIVHLMADRPGEVARMARMLENVENVAALELGFAPLLADDWIYSAVEQAVGELPLIVNLPWEQVLRLGPRLLAGGAEALSLAPPRGLQEGVSGRLFGPGLLAQSLLVTSEAVRAGIPLIGGCGVYSSADAQAMLAAGALAVQVDAVFWRGDFSLA